MKKVLVVVFGFLLLINLGVVSTQVQRNVEPLASGSDYIYLMDEINEEIKVGIPSLPECNHFGEIFKGIYCNGSKILEQKAWGNLCTYNFECLGGLGFCYDGRCYRGEIIAYVENKNIELQKNIDRLEEELNPSEENKPRVNSMTGSVVGEQENQNWFKKIWDKFLEFLSKKS